VNVAARVCALSSPDEVLVTEDVRRLTDDQEHAVAFVDRGIYVLKGVATPRRVFAALQAT
jgi:class 3 adenylate cyclase